MGQHLRVQSLTEFTSRNAIRHVFVSPYHPSSNGLAERAVQSFKSAWKKSSEGSTETRIARFLFHQRLTPHTSTGNSPAELLMGRRPRSLLDVVRPDLSKTVRQHQESQKRQHDRHAKSRQFEHGRCRVHPKFQSTVSTSDMGIR